jgi:hypothetical protein
MRTPAGHECRHYYQDFSRGKSQQECRLLKANPASPAWQPGDCARCTVPGILAANSSPDMALSATVRYKYLLVGRTVDVKAQCTKHAIDIADPHVGCPQCNAERPGLDLFLRALEESEQDSNPD